MNKIVFNNPFFLQSTNKYISHVLKSKLRETAGGKQYFKKCNFFLEKKLKTKKSIITNSCTSALEIAALLMDIKKNDEIIMPSYTFVSTANAFVLRGAKPVFVDIKTETLNIDEELIEKSITKKTKAIVVVHYAGIPCEMAKISKIAKKHNLFLIEDAAQALFSKYKNQYCGTIGDIGCISFHETKSLTSCEGGALLINNKKLIRKASIISNKGTNREYFNNNLIKYYSWQGIGSSFIPSEVTCAILYSQLKNYKKIIRKRKIIWLNYRKNLFNMNKKKIIKVMTVENKIVQNYHMFYLICRSQKIRDSIIKALKKFSIVSTFHYIPLHLSKAGKKYCKYYFRPRITEIISKKIIRLPLWVGVDQKRVISSLKKVLNVI